MIFSRKYAFITLACLSLAVIPVVRSATIDVVVGGPGVLKYDPEFVNASVGDVIRFTFKQKNHTVTQSTLESPCSPMRSGFDSGFVPVADSTTSGFQQAQLTIEDTNPIWIYCRQGNHCQQGMVFAVNPGDKFEAFKAAAAGNSTTTATGSATSGAVTVTATVTVSNGQTITTTYGSFPGSSAPTAATTRDHRVVVGGTGGKLTYEPANITAQAGDTVTFEFRQKNHTVTQSSFEQPCQALSAGGQAGFDSGFMAVADSATNFPTYTIQVNDTKPIWAYCRQGTHCASGMVFSINAVESGPNGFEAFKAKATGGASGGSSGNDNNAAFSTRLNGAGIIVAVVGVVLGSLMC
ncbi:hypothetical protein PQX77_016803 [Marasmius sp. AFHP31]|nr:hypothetical protein PQX77_016803 [Marasmius sp. AFHP31]